MKKQLFYLLLAAGVLSACGPAAPQLGKDSVEDVIGAMTLEERHIWLSVPEWWVLRVTVR